jgi:hypothetical protein
MTDIYDQVAGGNLPDPRYTLSEQDRRAETTPISSGPVYVSKEALFAKNLPEEDVQVEGVGTVRVRALTRAEVMRVTGAEMAKAKLDRYVLSRGLVAPALTEDEVGMWQRAGVAGRLEEVSRAIMRLSGLTEVAAKSVVPEDGDEL